jgi:hypothetical protein
MEHTILSKELARMVDTLGDEGYFGERSKNFLDKTSSVQQILDA